jgi:hypothetical protein
VLFICTDSWQHGIGEFVRKKCVEKTSTGAFKFQLVIFDLRLYSDTLSSSQKASLFLARNASLFEAADMLYYFAGDDRRGVVEDLCTRMQEAGRPVKVFLPGDPITLIGE